MNVLKGLTDGFAFGGELEGRGCGIVDIVVGVFGAWPADEHGSWVEGANSDSPSQSQPLGS